MYFFGFFVNLSVKQYIWFWVRNTVGCSSSISPYYEVEWCDILVNEAYFLQRGAFLFGSSELGFDLQAYLQDQSTTLGVSGEGD